MRQVFICDAIRTPIGRYGGALANVRTDDLGAIPIKALIQRNAKVDWAAVDDVYYGCANQAGEDNRNVARMAALLAGLPDERAGCNDQSSVRLGTGCGEPRRSYDSFADEAELIIAGGVESMTRAPFVMGKADSAFSRTAKIEDTTIGWRFVNPLMKAKYGIDSMPRRAENVAARVRHRPRRSRRVCSAQSAALCTRARLRSSLKAKSRRSRFRRRRAIPIKFIADEHPRETSLEALGEAQRVW